MLGEVLKITVWLLAAHGQHNHRVDTRWHALLGMTNHRTVATPNLASTISRAATGGVGACIAQPGLIVG
jgi:hypothetical protein